MTLWRFSCLAALPFLLATSVMAQVFPTRADGPVTDDAQLLDDEREAQLVARLNDLRAGGTALDVVTLPTMQFYTMGVELPEYAALLAENFGLTGQEDGKWGLVLVFPEDRQFRVATGPAFTAQDAAVEGIVNDVMRPAFQNDSYGEGLTQGVEALITRVIAPDSPVAATEVPAESGGRGLYWLLGGLVVAVGGIVALVKRGNAKFAATPCPSCGKTGLTRERVTLVEPTLKTEGAGETRISCPACGHSSTTPFTLPKKRAEGRQQTAETAGKTTMATGAAVGAAAVAGAALAKAAEPADHADAKRAAMEAGKPAPRTKAGMQAHAADDDIQEQAAGEEPAAARTQSGGASASW